MVRSSQVEYLLDDVGTIELATTSTVSGAPFPLSFVHLVMPVAMALLRAMALHIRTFLFSHGEWHEPLPLLGFYSYPGYKRGVVLTYLGIPSFNNNAPKSQR